MAFTTEETFTLSTVSHEVASDEEDTDIFWLALASILVFYVLILAVGWMASYVKKAWKGTSEDMMLAGRDIGLVVGIFTMTGGQNMYYNSDPAQ